MENNDDRKLKLEQNFRHSVAALQTYCENRVAYWMVTSFDPAWDGRFHPVGHILGTAP